MDKTYEQIAKELQAQIEERKEADRIAELETAAKEELEKIGYTDSNLENAFQLLKPFIAQKEDVGAVRAETMRFHEVVSNASGSDKKSNAKKRFFK